MKFLTPLIALLFIIPLVSFGQTDTTGSRVEKMKEIKNERIQKIEERKSEMKENISERRAEIKSNMETRKAEIKSNIETRKAEFKERIENRKGEIKKKLTDKKKEVVKNRLNNIFNRFDSAIKKLNTFAERIQNKINEFTERGINTGDAQDKLNNATNLIAESEEKVSAIKDTLSSSVEGEISKEAIKELVNEAKDFVKSAHSALIEAVKSLKEESDVSEESNN